MLHPIVLIINGLILWAIALKLFPFNQKGFEVLEPTRTRYKKHLKIIGTIVIIYALLLIFNIAN